MGTRNPDRVPIQVRYARGRTVADMIRERWDVISVCLKCGLTMSVNLQLIVRVSGPGTILWNHKARCKRIGCAGWVEFRARAPGMNHHDALTIDERG